VKSQQWDRRFIPIKGGQLSYVTRRRHGASLFLLPGTFGDSEGYGWAKVVPFFPEEWQITIMEMRGCGQSKPVAADGSIEMFAVDLLAVVDDVEATDFYVAGHSLGGMVAIQLAGLRPSNIRGVVAVEGWTDAAVLDDAFDGEVSNTLDGELRAISKAERSRLTADWTDEEIRQESEIWKRWSGRRILEQTRVPILSVWGDRGRPKPARELLQLPSRDNVQVSWMNGASHSLLIERPRELARVMTTFIQGCEVAVSAGRRSSLMARETAVADQGGVR
jgi:pimeloyl-ACP methyl ester carboxylesterase